MVRAIADGSFAAPGRQMAAALFKNTVLNTTQEEEVEGLWTRLSAETRQNIKEALLTALSDPNPVVRNSTARSVAAIAQLELPERQWADLITTMSSTSSHEDPNIRMAALKTLAYICEEVEMSSISDEDFQMCLSAFITRLGTDVVEEETLICIEAVLATLEYTRALFESGKGEVIMAQVLKCAVRPGNEEIRVVAFQCLAETLEFYESVAPFMPQIKEAVLHVLGSDEEDVRKQALELISRIAEEDEFRHQFGNRSKNYAASFQDALEIVMQNLMRIEAETEDEFDSTTYDAS